MGTTYEQIRGELRTGDVILFDGRSLVSRLIQLATLSAWSHIGFVMRVPGADLIMLLESTLLSSTKDIDSGKIMAGVGLVSLSDRLAAHEGRACLRQIQQCSEEDRLAVALAWREETRGRAYQRIGAGELLRAAYDGPFGANKEDLSTVFCSELVAEYHQRLGVLPAEPPSNEYTPANYAAGGMVDRLAPGLFGPEIHLAKETLP